MPLRILVVSPTDLEDRLGKTVLWRPDIEREVVADVETAFQKARQTAPRLVLVDAGSLPDAVRLLRRLRRDPATRGVSLAAIAGRGKDAGEEALPARRRQSRPAEDVAGRHLRPAARGAPRRPPRRKTRLSASFQLWCRAEPSGPLREAVVLNISVRGMLIETGEPLPMGTTVEIKLPLPSEPEPLPLVALVEREEPAPDGRFRSGVQFLILRDHMRERIRAYIESASEP